MESLKSLTESYHYQESHHWPNSGKHILGCYDDDTIVVYQAFSKEIAEYAVKNQRFGGDFYSFTRMSWIKPNFLWMMYRSGWARKRGQECILAIRIPKQHFDKILSQAYTNELLKKEGVGKDDERYQVRLQWDPDHKPCGASHPARKAIQLGLRGQALKELATEAVVSIEDITSFVHEQKTVLERKGESELLVPRERTYLPADPTVGDRIGMDS